jgi:hypothetical protein
MADKKRGRPVANYNDPLYIGNEMKGSDNKVREYYDNLSDEQKKKFSNYLMLRWGASVTGSSDLQSYYLISFNENVNKHFWDLNKHPKLQWLSITASSPGVGPQKHYWLAGKTNKKPTDVHKELAEAYPHLKMDEINLLVNIADPEAITRWRIAHGLGLDKE